MQKVLFWVALCGILGRFALLTLQGSHSQVAALARAEPCVIHLMESRVYELGSALPEFPGVWRRAGCHPTGSDLPLAVRAQGNTALQSWAC